MWALTTSFYFFCFKKACYLRKHAFLFLKTWFEHILLFVGAFELCSELYDSLEIKSIQIDTLGWVALVNWTFPDNNAQIGTLRGVYYKN